MLFKYSTRLPPGKPVKLISDNKIRKYGSGDFKFVSELNKILNHLIKNPMPNIVKIYNFSIFEEKNGYYKYFYDMERLCILPESWRQIIDYIADRWSLNNKIDIKSIDKFNNIDLWKENHKLMLFLYEIIKENIYWDIHSGNIMIDFEENLKLIDIEGFEFNVLLGKFEY